MQRRQASREEGLGRLKQRLRRLESKRYCRHSNGVSSTVLIVGVVEQLGVEERSVAAKSGCRIVESGVVDFFSLAGIK